MCNYRRLSTFTLGLLFLSGAFKPFNFFMVEALAACTIQGGVQSEAAEGATGATEPAANETVTCLDEDTAGVDAADSTGVTVTIQSPDGSISVTEASGIRLGDNASVNVEGPDRPITVQGNDVSAIEVGNMADISVEGVVSTAGDFSSAIVTGDDATVEIDGGEGRREIVDTGRETDDAESEVVIVSDGGIVSTTGEQSTAVTVGADSTVSAIGRAQILTTGANSDAVVLNGDGSELAVSANAVVSTEGRLSNAVQMNGTGSQLTVDGTVSSNAQSTAAVMGTADGVVLTVQDGGIVTALSSGSNAIEMTGTGARITVANGGEVKVASGDSVAIIAGGGATVIVEGTVSAAGDGSQGIVLGEGASLRVESQGRIETTLSATQAVRIDEMASSATVNIASDGTIDASGGQAIVDAGATNTSVVVDGSVTGGGSSPVLELGDGNDDITVNGSVSSTSGNTVIDLGDGDDDITVNGSVSSSSGNTVIDLGSGDDTLNANSSQGISGAGVLSSGGAGNDTLNLNNGTLNNSANYQQFEVTNVGTNTNANDPSNGNGTTLNVTDNQSGNQINVTAGSTLNVSSGGTVDLRADGSDNPSGVPGNSITFAAGSTANVQTEKITGSQPNQSFSNTTFAPGTAVGTGSGFIQGVTSNDGTTGTGQVQLNSDFTRSAQTANGMRIGGVLNDLAASATLSAAQQTALNTLIAEAADTSEGEAILFDVSGEVRVHAAASGLNAALSFNEALLPAGNRTISREPVGTTSLERDDGPFSPPEIGNSVWVSGLGNIIDVNSSDDSTAFNANSYGVALGYDRVVSVGPSHAAVVGVGAGYATTDVSSVYDSATVNAFSLGTYFTGSRGPLAGHVAASYSSQDVSSGVSSDGGGSVFAVSSEAFYDFRPNTTVAIGPVGKLGAAFGNYSGFSTNRDVLSVDYSDTNVSHINGAVGVRFRSRDLVDSGFSPLSLELLYEGSLGDNTVQFDGQLSGRDLSISAPTTNSSGFLIGAETEWAVSESSSFSFRYQGRLGSSMQSHTGEMRYSLTF